jgi:hypothetical protein|eukprot:COSAG02_NODE_4888_length_4861_cov_5.325283_1_plen_222_part_00
MRGSPGAALLSLVVTMASVTMATEKIIAVPVDGNLCPPYAPTCGNTWTSAGATVGDPCTIACATNADGTRWCPTTADTSGNEGTPWGWCAKTAEEGEKHAAGLDEEDDWTIAGSIIGVFALYLFGGIAYNYKVKGVGFALPHVDFWKNVGGLVKDGVIFSRAKYNGETYKGSPGYSPLGAASTKEHTGTPQTVAAIEEPEEYDDHTPDGAHCPAKCLPSTL